MSRLIQILMLGMLPLIASCTGMANATREAGNAPVAERDGPYHIAKQIRYSFTVTNTTGQLLEKAQFRTYAPVPQTSHQKVQRIKANLPYRSIRDDLGNEMLDFELTNIPPYGTKIVSITVDMLMVEQPVSISAGDRGRFLKPEAHIESDDARIKSLAKTLHEPAIQASAKKSFDWVVNNLFSEAYVAEDRGALYALDQKKGDCTEYAYLLTALYRAQQIPARPLGGYVFPGNNVVKAVDYHNWTEFHADGFWRVADAQKGAFEQKQTDYVAMRIIASDKGGAMGDSHRFSIVGDGLQVSMN